MSPDLWYAIVGIVLLGVRLSVDALGRLPPSRSIVYLAVGVVLALLGARVEALDPVRGASLVEASVLVHGISVSPLMRAYARRKQHRRAN